MERMPLVKNKGYLNNMHIISDIKIIILSDNKDEVKIKM